MIGPAGFDRMYAADSDPFGVASRWYERRKEAVVVASLQAPHYRLVWDTAAGTGHLALAIAEAGRCDQLVATDASVNAVGLARGLLDEHPLAVVAHNALPDVPDIARDADLTIAAEVLFYLPDDERRDALAALARQHGEVVSVHWRHHPDDGWLSGAAATEELDAALVLGGWSQRVRHDDTDFVLAGWVRRDHRQTGEDT